ncbi:hypothetical protein KZO25_03415 [Halomonas sp. ANAO-440]|uniref:DUF6311 domain-containing protein n=1 Tax=Halomonas sp. ANAO-440 TaxID=2861360 RepID=UPI001CAA5CE6|nr:DUF6311 domain-containing protein [Halomonas sp. ANAO-440]MBZ0329359.1 hypothetical protein [Halomonas sp. ANAO-440]
MNGSLDKRSAGYTALATALVALLGTWYLYAGLMWPTQAEWLLPKGDFLQHFLGWHFFRQEPWGWPLGAVHGYGTDLRSSIVFTDSWPLLALPLKLLHPWLPETFQYQGLASALHLALNAATASWLLARLRVPALAAAAGGLLLGFLPAAVFRGPGAAEHESLMAHWLILLGFYLVLFHRSTSGKAMLYWALLLVAAVLTHFYLFFMVGAMWSLWWLLRTLEQWRLFNATSRLGWAAYSVAQPLGILGVMWAAGYFHAEAGAQTEGFGLYAAGLFTYFNPALYLGSLESFSRFLAGSPPQRLGFYEGLAYVGLGGILLWLSALGVLLWHHRQGDSKGPSKPRRDAWWLAALALLLFFFSLSHLVALGSWFVELPLIWPEFIQTLLRASGRLAWVLMYLLLIAAIVALARGLGRRWCNGVVVLALALQLVDLHPWHRYVHEANRDSAAFAASEHETFAFVAEPRVLAALDGRDHVAVVPSEDVFRLMPIAWLAGQHGMSINAAYLARVSPQRMAAAAEPAAAELRGGDLAPTTLYALMSADWAALVCVEENVRCVETPRATFAWLSDPLEELP